MTRNDPYLSITDFDKVITNSLRDKFNDIGTLNWAVQIYDLNMILFDLNMTLFDLQMTSFDLKTTKK